MKSPVEHIRAFHAELREIRRDIHAHPELGFQEDRTSDLVADLLAGWGIEVHRGIARTGIVGVLHGGKTSIGRAIGLRADMDCLPMHETGAVSHRSTHDGRMHACGHDGHTAMLLGAARYLAETRNFSGTVYLIFQPAEEGLDGAKVMMEEGLFDRFPAQQIFALHNWPLLPPGKIAVRAGPIMAGRDAFKITIRGRGGHAAQPHLAIDPVVAAAQVITTLQTIASRSVNPLDAVVLSVCSMHTSQIGAYNVIPDYVQLIGTVRSFKRETRDFVEKTVSTLTTKTVEAFGARAEIEYRRGSPATINTAGEAEFAARVGERIFGKENVITDFEPVMGSEDFAYLLQARPGAYIWLGQGGGPGGCLLHNPGFDFNDDVIPLGAGYLAALVEQSLPVG